MAANTIHVSDELLADLQAKAAADGKTVDELAADAFRQYLSNHHWRRLIATKRDAARARGLTEADVPRLIQEARHERRGN
jgi:predicted transcriptional regulator